MILLTEDRSGAQLPPDIAARLTETLTLGLAYTATPDEVEISLSLVTPDEIRQLNNTYRTQDRVTDVLSFPFFEPWEIKELTVRPGTGATALGDIVICPEVAEAQAAAYGHSYTRELAFLAVHGLLHLLGYDHENADDEESMTEAQEAILQRAGIGRTKDASETAPVEAAPVEAARTKAAPVEATSVEAARTKAALVENNFVAGIKNL